MEIMQTLFIEELHLMVSGRGRREIVWVGPWLLGIQRDNHGDVVILLTTSFVLFISVDKTHGKDQPADHRSDNDTHRSVATAVLVCGTLVARLSLAHDAACAGGMS
jgi:hypothetical protein